MIALRGRLDSVLETIDRGRAVKEALLMQRDPSFQVPYAQPLLDAVALFEELKLGYALVGGIASMYYGRSRFTEDVDFVAISGHMGVLAGNPTVVESHHFDPTCSYKLYHQSGVSVDLGKDEFADEIVAHAKVATLAGRSIKLVEAHDLIAMKLRAARLKDDYDISEITRNLPIDRDRLRGLVTEEQFVHYEQIASRPG